jgi:hypothetical protein
MELREPPRPPARPAPDRVARALLAGNLAAVLLLAGLLLARGPEGPERGQDPALAREVAGKLKAAGALDAAASLYGEYLAATDLPAEERAKIAYSLGKTYLDGGRYEAALRWLYEAESLGAGGLADEVGAGVVHALERLGRFQAAQTALASRSGLRARGSGGEAARPAGDPVVATLGGDEIYRSDVEAALAGLPPEAARQLASPQAQEQLLRKVVADELLFRKAVKLDLDDDPEVRRQVEALTRQAVVGKLVEREVLARIAVDPADLANYFAAHRERYQPPTAPGQAAKEVTLPEVEAQVERDYRMEKAQSGYASLVESALAAEDVDLYPERMRDGRQ